MNNLLYSIKQVIKPKWINLIKIFSLSIGILIGGTIVCRTAYYNSYDRFLPNYGDIDFLLMDWAEDGSNSLSPKLYGPIAAEIDQRIPNITGATRFVTSGSYLFNGENKFSTSIVLGDTLFFEVLKHKVLLGEPKSVLSDPLKVMISLKYAQKVFNSDSPVGQILKTEKGTQYIVGGVFDIPQNSFLSWVDVVMPSENKATNSWDYYDAYYTFFTTDGKISRGDLDAQLNSVLKPHLTRLEEKGIGVNFLSKPIRDFVKYRGEGGEESTSGIISIIGLFILLVTSFNFALMQINSLISRAKLVGVHKTNGATTKEIFSMVIWETIVYILVSLLVAVVLLFILRSPIESVMGRFEDILAIKHLWSLGLMLLFMVLVSGVLPATIYSKIPAMEVFRKMASSNLWWKQILLLIQFIISIIVIVGLIASSLQYNFLTNYNLGYKTENLYEINGGFAIDKSKRDKFKQELLELPFIESATYVNRLIITGLDWRSVYNPNTGDVMLSAFELGVDKDFFSTYGVDILNGNTELFQNENVIITENLLDLTKSFFGDYKFTIGTADISGVASNIRNNLYNSVHPVIFSSFDNNPGDDMRITLRVGQELTKDQLAQINKITAENLDESYYFVPFKEMIYSMYSELRTVRDSFGLSGLVLILITALGVISYIATEIKGRSREIAIRRTHGATVWQIIFFVSRRIFIVAIIASVLSVPPSLYGLNMLFSLYFTEQIGLSWWIFALGIGAIILLIIWVTYVQTYKISRKDYVKLVGKI